MSGFTQCFPNQPKPEDILAFALRFYGLSNVTIRSSNCCRNVEVIGSDAESGDPVHIPYRLLCEQFRQNQVEMRKIEVGIFCTNPREECPPRP